jgi:hypothetical protein
MDPAELLPSLGLAGRSSLRIRNGEARMRRPRVRASEVTIVGGGRPSGDARRRIRAVGRG